MKLKYPRRKKRQIKGKTFNISPPDELRSKTMAKIPSKKTSIERMLASCFRKNKIKYRSGKHLFGKPDFIMYGHKIAVFCDGDFWHGYNYKENTIKTNSAFWNAKIKRNMERDKEVNRELKGRGWKVIRLWEHEIKKNPGKCIQIISKHIVQLDEKS